MAELQMQEELAEPDTPSAGKWKLYFKSDGLYIVDDAGTEIGPLIKDAPSDGTQYARKDAAWEAVAASGLPAGHLYGLTLSNNGTDPTNDIDIATGKGRDSTDAEDMELASALTKRLDAAWAVGTNQGGLDTGSIADTTYHIWLIKRSDTGVVDVLFSASATAPTMPANYDYKRRIGSIIRSTTILAFKQNGDNFDLSVPVLNVNTTNPGTSAVTATLTTPVGIVNYAKITASPGINAGGASSLILVTALDQTDSTPTSTLYNVMSLGNASINMRNVATLNVKTNTSSQIRYRCSASDANLNFQILTMGWIDTRGRL